MNKKPGDTRGQSNINSQMITIGEITGVHGVKGYVKIRSFAESSDIFAPGIRLFLSNPDKSAIPHNRNSVVSTDIHGKSAMAEKGEDWYKIVDATPHKKGIITLFEGLTRDIAETLVGRSVAVSKEDLPELDEDTYYWEDLIGLGVIDINSGHLGQIDHVIPTGSNDVFVVKSGDRGESSGKVRQNKEILVPALSSIVLSVDFDKREMIVDLPSGLKDI